MPISAPILILQIRSGPPYNVNKLFLYVFNFNLILYTTNYCSKSDYEELLSAYETVL